MIRDDNELAVTQERIAYFLGLLTCSCRVTSRLTKIPLVAESGYRRRSSRCNERYWTI